ncbi:MAG: methylenetetrahydrofolate reductase (NADPH) [Planctomycetota bacterium]
MKITEVHGQDRPIFSFEFFPPNSDEAAEAMMDAVEDLKDMLAPDFISVTYGAGGSTRARTLECVTRIQSEHGITSMAHLTCVGATVDEVRSVVDSLIERGIDNVLALRGDPPKGEAEFKATEGGFGNANELIAFLAENYDLCIGAACYPESHPESKTMDDCLKWTKAKVDAGASFLTTQLFFDNQDYFDYVKRARAIGIDVPIVPGIMPITNVAQIERFTKMCGAGLPDDLMDRLRKYQDDPALVMATGIEHAIEQCRELLERGAPGLHFYTLNKSHATRSILAAVKAVQSSDRT